MQEILAIALHSMHQDMVRLERVGMNLANALTPGYKRDVVMARPFVEVLDAVSANVSIADSMGAPFNVPGGDGALVIQSDLRPGTLKSTGQNLDVALAGQGFFEVATDSGPAYTRQGNFHVDARGRLVTAHGFPVMGKGGEIIINGQNPFIDSQGNIFENAKKDVLGESRPIAQLKIVQFENSKSLQRMSEGLLIGDGKQTLVNENEVQVRQGYLENSNVSSMREMVELVQTMRHFESMQKVTLGYDDMLGTAIRKLGEV